MPLLYSSYEEMVQVLHINSCPHQPSIRIVEPLQQLDGGALATPTGTHQGHRLPLADLQVQSLQDLGEWRRGKERQEK